MKTIFEGVCVSGCEKIFKKQQMSDIILGPRHEITFRSF